MRLPLSMIVLPLALAACGKDKAADEARKGPAMSANAISGNDVTAIDAVTGEAANMAADVDFNENLANSLENAAEGERVASSGSSRPRATAPRRESPPPAQGAPAEAPAATNAAQ